jgi:hypothetical protein
MNFVINRKKLTLILTLSLVGVIALCIVAPLVMKAAAVSSSLKKVPVYCVNTTQKKVALTVNAAWDDKELDDFLEIFKKPYTFWCVRLCFVFIQIIPLKDICRRHREG